MLTRKPPSHFLRKFLDWQCPGKKLTVTFKKMCDTPYKSIFSSRGEPENFVRQFFLQRSSSFCAMDQRLCWLAVSGDDLSQNKHFGRRKHLSRFWYEILVKIMKFDTIWFILASNFQKSSAENPIPKSEIGVCKPLLKFWNRVLKTLNPKIGISKPENQNSKP